MTATLQRQRFEQPWWEASFADLDTSSFGDPSTEIVDLVPRLAAGSSVLDLGCGDGRHALLLARHGHRVTAVDHSRAAIRKLRHRMASQGLEIDARVVDMRAFDFEEYDLVVAHGSLMLVERHHWQRLIAAMKRATLAGGYNAVTVLTDLIPPPEDLAAFCLGLFAEDELFGYYDDWQIRLRRKKIKHDQHPGGIRHRHPLNKLVAQNPGPRSADTGGKPDDLLETKPEP